MICVQAVEAIDLIDILLWFPVLGFILCPGKHSLRSFAGFVIEGRNSDFILLAIFLKNTKWFCIVNRFILLYYLLFES